MIQQKDAQLEQHINTLRQLTTQVREKDDGLREMKSCNKKGLNYSKKTKSCNKELPTSADFREKYRSVYMLWVVCVHCIFQGIRYVSGIDFALTGVIAEDNTGLWYRTRTTNEGNLSD